MSGQFFEFCSRNRPPVPYKQGVEVPTVTFSLFTLMPFFYAHNYQNDIIASNRPIYLSNPKTPRSAFFSGWPNFREAIKPKISKITHGILLPGPIENCSAEKFQSMYIIINKRKLSCRKKKFKIEYIYLFNFLGKFHF